MITYLAYVAVAFSVAMFIFGIRNLFWAETLLEDIYRILEMTVWLTLALQILDHVLQYYITLR